jgi:alanine racemase
VPLLGAHQLYSALAALAVGLSYSVDLEDGLRALTELEPLPGRMRPLAGPNGCLLVDDSFNANPESVMAALDWLQAVRNEQSKMVLVMGDMDELGSYSPIAHLQVGQYAAGKLDRLVTKGDQAAETARAVLERGMAREDVLITFSTEDAAKAAAQDLGPKDVLLAKGSPAARMERVERQLLPNPDDAALLARQESAFEQVWMDRPDRPTWVHINMEAIAHNVRRLKEIVGPEVALMAVVKANAYGHGAIPVSTTALNNGAEYLGVASINEAMELREGGVIAPMLILGYTPPWAARQVVRYDVAITLYDVEVARAFDRAAREMNATLTAHVKVDTGMGRLGLLPGEATTFFRGLRNLRNLQIEGIFTHFSVADEDVDYTRQQIATFEGVVDPLLAAGFRFKYIHAANSAAAIHLPDSRFNMVRCGIAMLGLNPSPLTPVPADFKPAMEWKTTVAQVKRLPPGSFVGYGNTYRTQAHQTIAIIPVGYADGFRRAPLRWKHVLVKGEYAPLVGRVSMDQTAIDVTHIEDVKIGDEVVLIGRQGKLSLTAEDVAEYLDTVNYEVVSTILARVPRVK